MKNPYVLGGVAVFMLIGAYMFGVDGVIALFNAITGVVPEVTAPQQLQFGR